jgi:spermidine synthase
MGQTKLWRGACCRVDWPQPHQVSRPMEQHLRSHIHRKSAPQLLSKGWRLLERGQLDKAAAASRAVLTAQPGHADATYLIGVVRLRQGRVSEAHDHIATALRLQPSNAGAHLAYGNVLVRMGQLKEALVSYDRAISLKPDLVEAYIKRGNALLDLGHCEEALTSYDTALALRPTSLEALYNRGNALNAVKRYEEGVAAYDQVIALAPDNAQAYNARGQALTLLRRFDDAASSYLKAIAEQPTAADFHANYGNVLRAMGRLDEAQVSYRRAVQLNKAYQKIHEGLGIVEADGVRSLHFGTPISQSAMRLAAPFEIVHPHDRALMAFLLFKQQPNDVLSLGLGGGAVPKFIHRHLPAIRTRVVEIDADVISTARTYFHVPEDDHRLQVLLGDAGQYLADHPDSTTVLLADLFDGMGMPRNLYCQKFFDDCFAALNAGGVALVHLWNLDEVFPVYLEAMSRSFSGNILKMPVGQTDSTILIGFQRAMGDLSRSTLTQRATALEATYGIEFTSLVADLELVNAADAGTRASKCTTNV